MFLSIEKAQIFLGKALVFIVICWFVFGVMVPLIAGTMHYCICEVTTLPNQWCSVDFHPWSSMVDWILPRAFLILVPLCIVYLLLRWLED